VDGAGGALALQAGGQVLLVTPGLGPCSLGQLGGDSRNIGAFNARAGKIRSVARSRPGWSTPAAASPSGVAEPNRQLDVGET